MTRLQKSALGLAFAALLGLALYQALALQREQAKPTATSAAPPLPRPAPAAPAVSISHVAPASVATASEPPAAPLTPDQRVALLRQLLAELPAQRLPELRLLSDDDWLTIAKNHTLESAADIRLALADLRAIARKEFAEILQNALRDYTTASDGQLPDDLAPLASRLAAPADAEMLARYELVRTGKLGDPSEKLIREKKTSDMILSIGLDGWSLTNNSDLPPAFGETEDDALDRAKRAVGTALGDEDLMANLPSTTALGAVAKGVSEQFAAIYGSEDAFGDALKQAIQTFQTAHPEEAVSNLAQVLPYLAHADKFADAMRLVFAQFAYLTEHPGQPPADSAALQPYLNRPFNPTEALKQMKLSMDGEHGSLSFNWETKK